MTACVVCEAFDLARVPGACPVCDAVLGDAAYLEGHKARVMIAADLVEQLSTRYSLDLLGEAGDLARGMAFGERPREVGSLAAALAVALVRHTRVHRTPALADYLPRVLELVARADVNPTDGPMRQHVEQVNAAPEIIGPASNAHLWPMRWALVWSLLGGPGAYRVARRAALALYVDSRPVSGVAWEVDEALARDLQQSHEVARGWPNDNLVDAMSMECGESSRSRSGHPPQAAMAAALGALVWWAVWRWDNSPGASSLATMRVDGGYGTRRRLVTLVTCSLFPRRPGGELRGSTWGPIVTPSPLHPTGWIALDLASVQTQRVETGSTPTVESTDDTGRRWTETIDRSGTMRDTPVVGLTGAMGGDIKRRVSLWREVSR